MNINISPLRITLTGLHAAALRRAAKKDSRTMSAFLEVHLPDIALFEESRVEIYKEEQRIAVAQDVVRSPEPILERITAGVPAAHSPWVPNPVVPKPEVALRPDGKPYELGYPCTLGSGVTFHSSEEWAASSEFAAAYPKGT